MLDSEEKLQIVAFSTNESRHTPNDIINIFLEQHSHSIIKKSGQTLAFSTVLSNSQESIKIMICSVLNLTRQYKNITEVNCYLIFIDLENEESKDKFESIINYTRNCCDLNKTIFVLGMISGNNEETKYINKEQINNILKIAQIKYEYKEIDINKIKEVRDIIMEILIYSSENSIKDYTYQSEREGDKANSCDIF